MNLKKRETLLIALGGNALQRSGERGTVEEQFSHVKETVDRCVKIVEAGYSLVITHGNGPQVGSILLKNEYSEDRLPAMPLDVCVAETQGMIGYMIQQQLYNKFRERGRGEGVITLCTQTLVDQKDRAFKNPTKPIGPFYTKEHAQELRQAKGWCMVEQIGKGFRRVVPSPLPVDVVEADVIKQWVGAGVVVIVCGGGGIPVIKKKDGRLHGVEAVVDKDHTAALLGRKIGAGILMILTDVEQVSLNFGSPEQSNLGQMTVEEARRYVQEGEFCMGSMGPKVEAACAFMRAGGKRALITSLEKAQEALEGVAGTSITK